MHCSCYGLLFNVKAKGTIGVHAETVACTCMPRLWMLGIDEHHCDTLLAASCVRVVIKKIVKKRGNKKSINSAQGALFYQWIYIDEGNRPFLAIVYPHLDAYLPQDYHRLCMRNHN